MIDEIKPWTGEVAAAGDDEANIQHKSHHTENGCEENEDVLTREVKSTVKQLVSFEMATLVEEPP